MFRYSGFRFVSICSQGSRPRLFIQHLSFRLCAERGHARKRERRSTLRYADTLILRSYGVPSSFSIRSIVTAGTGNFRCSNLRPSFSTAVKMLAHHPNPPGEPSPAENRVYSISPVPTQIGVELTPEPLSSLSATSKVGRRGMVWQNPQPTKGITIHSEASAKSEAPQIVCASGRMRVSEALEGAFWSSMYSMDSRLFNAAGNVAAQLFPPNSLKKCSATTTPGRQVRPKRVCTFQNDQSARSGEPPPSSNPSVPF